MDDADQRSLAIEELKILSSIIGRIEGLIYQRQGWLLTLITGLTVAEVSLRDNPSIHAYQFALISVAITVVFYIADLVQRVTVHRAIVRSGIVESSLSDSAKKYDGLKISESLGQGNGWSDFYSVSSGLIFT